MKKILFASVLLLISFFVKAQTISLGTDNEYCPNVEYEFTVTLPGPYYSISASQMQITQQPTAFNAANTNFKFKAKFADVNSKQFVEIQYNSNGKDVFKPEYKKVKSLFYANANNCDVIQPKFTSNNAPVTSFSAPLCQVSTFNITFSNIKWYTEFESPKICFGSISDYEYLLPAGWKLGNNTSNGTAWLQGTNTVTITSDLSTGHGSTILIRPKNTCGANLANGQIPAQIGIIRSAGNLTMSASPNSIPCGSTSPVTFTINNTSSLTGITGYVWNLGSGNGWLYNGSSAPSSINTSTNSIILTPVCGAGLSAPSVNITLSNGGNNCSINVPAATLNISAPALSIQGTQSLCAGTQNYSLTGMPCNATNIWSILPQSGVVSLNQTSGQNTSLTRVADGNITLTAKVSACGAEYPVSIPIHVGAYSGSYYSLNVYGGTSGQPLGVCPNQTYNFYVSSSIPASNFNWTPPTGWTVVSGNGNSSAYIKTPTSVGGGTVSVSFTEVCGTSITLSKGVYYNSNLCNLTNLYTIAPNPVTSNITITSTSPETSYYISQVEITDLYGQVKMSKSWYPYKYQQVTFDATYLYPAGNYIARIYTGTQWFYKQFVKQ
ncbi:MAG: T9SS type A sorting domain-containing protein [Agriterribacter sp.]